MTAEEKNTESAAIESAVWKMFCFAHPHEAYAHNPDGFWEYFQTISKLPREQMVALLKECE